MSESFIMTFFLDNSVFITFIYTEKGKNYKEYWQCVLIKGMCISEMLTV